MVLVRQMTYRGKHKIQDRWDSEPYRVIDKPYPDIPVYRVVHEGEKIRTLQRNLLLPLLHVPGSTESVQEDTG